MIAVQGPRPQYTTTQCLCLPASVRVARSRPHAHSYLKHADIQLALCFAGCSGLVNKNLALCSRTPKPRHAWSLVCQWMAVSRCNHPRQSLRLLSRPPCMCVHQCVRACVCACIRPSARPPAHPPPRPPARPPATQPATQPATRASTPGRSRLSIQRQHQQAKATDRAKARAGRDQRRPQL